jgi:hypothetical protein
MNDIGIRETLSFARRVVRRDERQNLLQLVLDRSNGERDALLATPRRLRKIELPTQCRYPTLRLRHVERNVVVRRVGEFGFDAGKCCEVGPTSIVTAAQCFRILV